MIHFKIIKRHQVNSILNYIAIKNQLIAFLDHLSELKFTYVAFPKDSDITNKQ